MNDGSCGLLLWTIATPSVSYERFKFKFVQGYAKVIDAREESFIAGNVEMLVNHITNPKLQTLKSIAFVC